MAFEGKVTNKGDSFARMSPAEMKSGKRIAKNSWRYVRADGAECIRLHQTDVAAAKAGQVTFDSNGWRTVTTKDRMNMVSGPFRVYSDGGRWFVRDYNTGQVAEFFDGITLPRDFKQSKKAAAKVKRETAMLAQIDRFCKKLKALPALPMPNGGDCWLCSMFDRSAKPGAKTHDSEHIRSHVSEGYIHGALIVNALRGSMGEAGVAYYLTPENWQRNKTYIAGKVRRYLKAQLGVGAV